MKTKNIPTALLAIASASFMSVLAQPFQSGSTGSDGVLNVTQNQTLDVPAGGIFHYTTITINVNRVLSFRRNALNTPVYLLATGDVTINGVIDVSGTRGTDSVPGYGGSGGFDGGAPGSTGFAGGDGQGPGGGKAGTGSGDTAAGPGSYATVSGQGPAAKKGATYGSPLLFPIVGGSGGGGVGGNPGFGGGGGGGAIVIASSTRIIVNAGGGVGAEGGNGLSHVNTGSGGAVRLVAPIVQGGGYIAVRGNGGNSNYGDGRARVDALDRTTLDLKFYPTTTASVGGFMVVFPNPQPRLDIIEAAGSAVALDTPAHVLLPAGSSPNQTVKIRASAFGQIVPIRVVLTPDNGPSQSYDGQIDNAAANPAETTVNVTLPVNVLTHIHVWTR